MTFSNCKYWYQHKMLMYINTIDGVKGLWMLTLPINKFRLVRFIAHQERSLRLSCRHRSHQEGLNLTFMKSDVNIVIGFASAKTLVFLLVKTISLISLAFTQLRTGRVSSPCSFNRIRNSFEFTEITFLRVHQSRLSIQELSTAFCAICGVVPPFSSVPT